MKMEHSERNVEIEKLLSETNKGYSAFDAVKRIIRGLAYNKGIPDHTAEEAISRALENIVTGFGTYDKQKGNFLSWASSVAHNALMDQARTDTPRNEPLMSLSGTEDEGVDLIHCLIGQNMDAEYLIDKEERIEKIIEQYKIAVRIIGTYGCWIDGEWQKRPIIDLYFEKYIEHGARGWLEASAQECGISTDRLYRLNRKARDAWQEMEALE